MEAFKTHLQNAKVVGEGIVDRNPTACQADFMRSLEGKFGGSRATYFLGFFAMGALTLYLIGGLPLITNLIGFLYPAFASFKAIDAPDAHASAQWMSYWTLFGAFFTLEIAFSFVLQAIPFYNLVKVLFLVYCFHPYSKGATVMYDTFIRPVVVQHVMPGTSKARGHSAVPSSSAPYMGFTSKPPSNGDTIKSAPTINVPNVSDFTKSSSSELRVVVVSATDIVPTDAPGAGVDCDPYCVLEVLPEGSRPKEGGAENTKYKTVCKTGTANPVWNEGVTIPQVEHLDAKLVVTVCNKRAMGRDQCLGKIEVSLSDIKGVRGSADVVKALAPAEEGSDHASGDLRITVKLQ